MCNTKICKRCNKEQSIDNFYKVPSIDRIDNSKGYVLRKHIKI